MYVKTIKQFSVLIKTRFAITLPQSLWLEELAEAILAFFLLSFSFSPASTTSLVSLRQFGQYLRRKHKSSSQHIDNSNPLDNETKVVNVDGSCVYRLDSNKFHISGK